MYEEVWYNLGRSINFPKITPPKGFRFGPRQTTPRQSVPPRQINNPEIDTTIARDLKNVKQQTIKVPGIEAEQIITNGGKIANQQIIHITGNGITEHITMPESGQLIIITQQLPLPDSGMSLYHYKLQFI